MALPDRQSAWLISRYDDVAAVLKDERFAKNKAAALTTEQAAKQPWVPAMFRPLTRNMLDLDPPTTRGCEPWCIGLSRPAWSSRCEAASSRWPMI